jgi:hypothetical protein
MTLQPGKLILAKDYIHGPADPDVAAYIAAVETADGQGLEEEVKVAYSDFITGCKADGIWNAIKASCILAGARTLAGALVPLAGATAPTNNGPFVAGDYDRRNGLGDSSNSNKYLASNYSLASSNSLNTHGSIWLASTPTNSAELFGARETTIGNALLGVYRDTSNSAVSYGCWSTGNQPGSSISNNSLIGVARNNATNFDTQSGSTSASIPLALAASLPATLSPFLFSRNNLGSPLTYSTARIAFYSFGEYLNLSLLNTRVSNLITAFGAAIP